MGEWPAGPIWVTQVDVEAIADCTPPTRANGSYAAARIVVRLHGQPIGEVLVPMTAGALPAALADLIEAEVGPARRAHLDQDELRPAKAGEPPCTWPARFRALGLEPPLVSIVLATCRRPERLARTLRTLAAQSYPAFEVLVVDNCPSHPGAADVVAELGDGRFRPLLEPTPGLSRARNLGLRAAAADVVALTDDDVDVDPDWLGSIVVPFYEDPDLACVTGLIMPAQLETEQERVFEQFGGFAKGYVARTYSLSDEGHGPLFPYTAGMFGSGANMACRRESFLGFGGFALDLGVATISRGGEDLDTFLSTLYAGHRLRYEPRAIVWHELRPSQNMLARQIYSYGIGLSAMVTKRVVASTEERRRVMRSMSAAARYLLSKDSPKNAAKSAAYPRRLTAYELIGLAYGPVAYLRSRRRLRRLAR